MSVMLVEDEEAARKELAIYLEKRGVVVNQARNATEAILNAKLVPTNLVLMDIQLGPGQTGIEAARQIQRRDPHCSVIFVTAYDDPYHRELAVESKLRVVDWIQKPIVSHLDKLLKLIDEEPRKADLRRSLHNGVEQKVPLGEHLQLFLKSSRALAPEAVDEVINDLVMEKVVDIDGGIRLLYAALGHFAGRFSAEPVLRERTEVLLSRLETFEEREADELEERFQARFRAKPGEVNELYDWGRSLLEK